MALLERLLRRPSIAPRYYPFSQPAYRGGYPFGPAKRDFFLIPNLSPLSRSLIQYRLSLPSRHQSINSLYQDRRLWHPEGVNRPAVSKTASRVQMIDLPPDMAPRWEPNWERIMTPPRRINWRPATLTQLAMKPGRVAFDNPENVIICLERKMRKEVLHALGVAGGPASRKIHNWNAYSRVRCF